MPSDALDDMPPFIARGTSDVIDGNPMVIGTGENQGQFSLFLHFTQFGQLSRFQAAQ